MRKLSLKQQIFADEYIITGNATKSAIKAGYSEKYANTNASKLLQNTTIKAYIEKRLAELKKESIAEADEVLQFLTSVMRGEVTEPVTLLDGDGYQKVVELKPSVQTRRSAAVDIGKRYALFTDKQQLEVSEVPMFIDDISGDDDG
ncbi:terminase small subunit [Brochothrix phage NF5]|uniref:terminase small subunit n=1 Tax=Brochothrix phage NF5 TaxID=764561 RepID=UPI0001D9AB8D|nr:terminase small subunit [Brochothrix phage NF5]ADH03022.1 gp1 [Brochothrix phage NF5]